jgi:lysozyme
VRPAAFAFVLQSLRTPPTERMLALEEGFRPEVYRCTSGYWTCGVGHVVTWDRSASETEAARAAGRIAPYPWSVADAMEQFEGVVEKTRRELDDRLPWWREQTEPRQAVLISMAYQMGINGLMGFRNTLKAWQAGAYDDVATRMMNSKWARQTPARARRHARQVADNTWHFNQ